MPEKLLTWRQQDGYQDAQLGEHDDGVYFSLVRQPTCHRRGQWKLIVDVCSGENHHKWGCFDSADQPMRYYHSEATAKIEAEAIAAAIFGDLFANKYLNA